MRLELADIVSNPLSIGAAVFVILFASTIFGMALSRRLREYHLSAESKDAVRLGMASVATMAALVLGLLVASANDAYNTEKAAIVEMSSKIIFLDKVLINYGSETAECRSVLAITVQAGMSRIWPHLRFGRELPAPQIGWAQTLPLAIQKLHPRSEAQEKFKSQAADLAAELGQMRWLLFEETESSISMVLIVIAVFWLALTFISIGLFAPPNVMVIITQLFASLSIAAAIFLIFELTQPFDGVISIPSRPMQNALSQLAK